MLVEKSMHPDWLSNAFLVAVEGGPAVFVDSGADIAPLIGAAERWGVTPVALLRTHSHHDHVENEDELAQRYSIPVLAESGEWKWDGLQVQGLATPGHSDDGLSFVIDEGVVATGDTLFRDAVGGGDVAVVRRSVMDVLLELPDTTRVLPGHADETTIGRERRENPFIRVWSGAEPEGSERVRVGGRDATLLVWSPDYDGNGKAWVRFDDGEEATVGGSRVERDS
jgi:glyoxylase-like metal-dependent hydrolase (beta-lactamase superfamily II)